MLSKETKWVIHQLDIILKSLNYPSKMTNKTMEIGKQTIYNCKHVFNH